MTHNVVKANKMVAKNVDAYVRPVTSASDIDNGNIFALNSKYATSGSGMEVWLATQPTTSHYTGLWMAMEPEIPMLVSGTNVYRGIGTVQNFYNLAGQVFTAVKPQAGDIIVMTDDGLTGSHSTGSYIVATGDDFKFNWAAAAPASGSLCYGKFLNTTYISLPDGSIGTQRVTAYQFEIMAN